MMTEFNIDQFVYAYVTCALWSSTDENGEPLDTLYTVDDVAPECYYSMREECEDFIQDNEVDLREYCAHMASDMSSGEASAGHDFWLTRNGHGAGFWDRGLGALGERLSEAAKAYGSVDLYVGDDGLIHC